MSRADAMRMAYGHAMIIIMISPTITLCLPTGTRIVPRYLVEPSVGTVP